MLTAKIIVEENSYQNSFTYHLTNNVIIVRLVGDKNDNMEFDRIMHDIEQRRDSIRKYGISRL